MFQKKALWMVFAAALLSVSVYAEESKAVDCDVQFESCIEKCENSSNENCERACDEAYEACLTKEQSEERED